MQEKKNERDYPLYQVGSVLGLKLFGRLISRLYRNEPVSICLVTCVSLLAGNFLESSHVCIWLKNFLAHQVSPVLMCQRFR